MLEGKVPLESSFVLTEEPETPAASPRAEEPASAEKAPKEKKKKGKAEPGEPEDLDALLAEFGVEVKPAAGKKKKKK